MSKLRNILAPTDFSPNSSQAIQFACDLAKQNNSVLHLLHIESGTEDESIREDRLERLNRVVDAASELDLTTVKKVEFGKPAATINQYARDENIDTIIMGTHGRSGLAHLAIGSVTELVIKDAPCAVTVLGPHNGENATLVKAFDVVESMVGNGLNGGEEDGHALLAKTLVARLRIPTTTAILMIDQLIERGCLKWQEGTWKTVEGAELIDAFEAPILSGSPSDSQASDLIKRAMKLRATDIHIDPIKNAEYQIRLRIDGDLHKYCELDNAVAEHLINQLKNLARLDIADPFRPLEGRVNLPSGLQNTEVRISTIPVPEGQAAALRILDPTQIFRPLSVLGLGSERLESLQQIMQLEGGLILVTGPTGSGKTTTVYSMLESVGGEKKNIVSIEDPVEYSAPFVRQISVDAKNGLSLSNGLRTLLRMDPDILFIGEIRDPEAAQIALRAATSGKTVYSTLHTRNIASTVRALLDLGLDSNSLSNQLAGIINQRLAKRLCPQCRTAVDVNEEQADYFEKSSVPVPERLYLSPGCSACNNRGYRGRVGIFEFAVVDPDFRRCLRQFVAIENIQGYLNNSGIQNLTQDALSKATEGLISYQEAISIQWLR